MLRGVATVLEKHHRVQLLDEAIEAAVQAVAPLHPGAPAARQGGEPARHRLRPRGGEPACDAGRGGGLPAPHRGAGDRSSASSGARRRSASRSGDAAAEVAAQAGRPSARGWTTLRGALERTRRRCVDAAAGAARASCASGNKPVDDAPTAPARRRDRDARCWPSCRQLQGKLAAAAGRSAADPARGRRPGGRPAWSPTGPASRSAAW